MSKAAPSPLNLPEGFPVLNPAARESFDSLIRAYGTWLSNANRVQTEMIRFIGERFSKDVALLSRFAECHKPEDFVRLQGELITDLASDYQQEGAKVLALFGDASKQAWSGFLRAADASRPG